MAQKQSYDAVVVGSGPNGLAAAIVLAQAGRSVLVLEERETIGGGMRSAALTLPGFVHDICSAVHPLGVGSLFFKTLPLAHYGLEWIYPPLAVAHPLDDGTAVVLEKSVEQTAAGLGRDGEAYLRLVGPVVRDWEKYAGAILGPLRWPNNPVALVRFGLRAIWPAEGLARLVFREQRAKALLAGLSAHSTLPLNKTATAAFGLVLAILGHVEGWPMPKGGAQTLANALAAYLRALGGEIVTSRPVRRLEDLPPARALLFDLTPRQLLTIVGPRFPARYQRHLEHYRYGPGVFKIDYALSAPVPWKAPECGRAGTIHLGGTLAEVAASERANWVGLPAEKPYVLITQPSLFDPSRAPAGQHTLWAYCHLPNGSTFDMTARIEEQIERFAPGFADLVLARQTMAPADFERYNLNYVGGDINGGVQDLGQLFTRPTWRWVPYSTPAKGIYICSSATPPGGGVHGMSGYHAAQAVLRDKR